MPMQRRRAVRYAPLSGGALVTRIDHNGKVFTDQVRKQKVTTIIQTESHRIRGVLFHDSDGRLKDDLNSPESFVALTDAEFLSPNGQVVERAEFLALSKRHIVWVMPSPTTEHGADDQHAEAD
jgi:hypothetical protein